jgi:hypothetical protein
MSSVRWASSVESPPSLNLSGARNARCASTKQVARELWKIMQEAEAAKLGNGRMPDIGEPPQGLEIRSLRRYVSPRLMVSRDWAAQHIHECIVGWPCRFCPARNLGLPANWLGRL